MTSPSEPKQPAASGADGHVWRKANGFKAGMLVNGKYVIEEVLGEGGLGVVVRAKHLQIDQKVAIKFLKPEAAAGDGDMVERFLREARLAAKIRSEHAIRVHDVGTFDGAPYMVLEYLEGRDLAAILRQEGPLPVQRAVDHLLEAVDAVAEAHALGIIHRDLKPENLFVARRAAGATVVKVLDFGISKVSPKGPSGKDVKRITGGGELFGTPAYMAPEQIA